MDKLDKQKLRTAIQRYIDNNPQSNNWYAQEMKMGYSTLRDFLDSKSDRSTSQGTTRKIKRYLNLKGIEWDKE